jgi:hypothetical protein
VSDADSHAFEISSQLAVRTSETSVDNYFTRQYIPEDNSEHHTRRRENLKSHKKSKLCVPTKRMNNVYRGFILH